MNRQLLRTCMLLFTALMMPLSLLAISNNYGYKGTIEIKVGENCEMMLDGLKTQLEGQGN